MKLNSIVKFIAEAGMLKRVRRSGWWVLGIKDAESVAEHSFRCAVIGYCLARMEGIEPYKAVLMSLFNDIHEARINDLHKMAAGYFKLKEAENKAFKEQIDALPLIMKNELALMNKEYRAQITKEALIARDADLLECLIQAKEYEGHGFKEAVKFTKKAPRLLKTAGAKQLWKEAKRGGLNTWWEKLSRFER